MRYQLKLNRDAWTEPLELEAAMTATRSWTKGATPFRLRVDGDLGPELDRATMLRRLEGRLKRLAPAAHRLELRGTDLRIRYAAVEVPWEPANTPGTPAIDLVYAAVFDNPTWADRGVVSWGIVNCRRIAGSQTWSQHAWGNGLDIHASFAVMTELASFLSDEADAGRLPIAQILFDSSVWTPREGWRHAVLSTPHTDHVHVSGAPMKEGTPPCASTST